MALSEMTVYNVVVHNKQLAAALKDLKKAIRSKNAETLEEKQAKKQLRAEKKSVSKEKKCKRHFKTVLVDLRKTVRMNNRDAKLTMTVQRKLKRQYKKVFKELVNNVKTTQSLKRISERHNRKTLMLEKRKERAAQAIFKWCDVVFNVDDEPKIRKGNKVWVKKVA